MECPKHFPQLKFEVLNYKISTKAVFIILTRLSSFVFSLLTAVHIPTLINGRLVCKKLSIENMEATPTRTISLSGSICPSCESTLTTRCYISSRTGFGWLRFGMFHHFAQLHSHFCQHFICPCQIGQIASSKPRSTSWNTL